MFEIIRCPDGLCDFGETRPQNGCFRERDPHQPTAAFFTATEQGGQHTERAEAARAVIVELDRHERDFSRPALCKSAMPVVA